MRRRSERATWVAPALLARSQALPAQREWNEWVRCGGRACACVPCRTLTKPFIKTTSTDEFRLLGHITGMLACISGTLTTGCPQPIQLAASEVRPPPAAIPRAVSVCSSPP